MLSMVSNLVLAAMCIAYLLVNGGVSFDQLQAISINKGIFLVMPVLAFGFAGHTNLLPGNCRVILTPLQRSIYYLLVDKSKF